MTEQEERKIEWDAYNRSLRRSRLVMRISVIVLIADIIWGVTVIVIGWLNK